MATFSLSKIDLNIDTNIAYNAVEANSRYNFAFVEALK